MVATSLSLSIVFGALFGQSLAELLPYVMAGMIFFNIATYPLNEAPEVFVGYAGIIKNHAYPFTYYVFESLSKNFITFLHNYVVYIATCIILQVNVIPNFTLVPALVLVYITAAIYGTLVAMLSARYRDLRFMFPYVAQLLFFITPIFWKADHIKGVRRWILDYNPFSYMLDLLRTPAMGGYPAAQSWIVVLAVAAFGAVLWLFFFAANRRKIPFWV